MPLSTEQISALERLVVLRDSRAIGETEFDALKAEIMTSSQVTETSNAVSSSQAPGELKIQEFGHSWLINRAVTFVSKCVYVGIRGAEVEVDNKRSDLWDVWTSKGNLASKQYWTYNGCQLHFTIEERDPLTFLMFETIGGGIAGSGQKRLLSTVLSHIRAALTEDPSNACRSMRQAAMSDSESAVLNAAIDQFSETMNPQQPVTEWLFASGRVNLVVRHDAALLACTPSFVGKFAEISPAEYTVDALGEIVGATIGPHTFTAVRPKESASRLLAALNAIRRSDDSTPVYGIALPPGGAR